MVAFTEELQLPGPENNQGTSPDQDTSPVAKCASLQSIPEAAELTVAGGQQGVRKTSFAISPREGSTSRSPREQLTRASGQGRRRIRRTVFRTALSDARGERSVGERSVGERMRLYIWKHTRAAYARLRAHANLLFSIRDNNGSSRRVGILLSHSSSCRLHRLHMRQRGESWIQHADVCDSCHCERLVYYSTLSMCAQYQHL